jgi:two-component SAPR family response regulator
MLARAFGSLRARQFYDEFDTNPRFGATMCALALEHEVEPEFVRRVIELQGFAPPLQAGAAWPWPVRIATFGRFEVAVGGQPIAAVRKTPRKPLELLKALIAAGGRSVDKDRLADWLWPDASGEAASAALGMAVMRLRKLLSAPQAVVLEDGKVGLDPEHVWLDLWAFDREVDALHPLLRAQPAEHLVAAIGENVLALYRGPFLGHENPQRWLLATRERARARFLRTLTDAGRYWEQCGRWPAAAALYERGLDVDPLAEDFYRGLMRCHVAQGRTAEVALTWQRCRDLLEAELGVPPSAETEALFRAVPRR